MGRALEPNPQHWELTETVFVGSKSEKGNLSHGQQKIAHILRVPVRVQGDQITPNKK